MAGGTGHIIQSLIANSLIAGAKGVAAAVTGSGAMLAETLHSSADCGNQLLLLMGVKRAQKPASAEHPLGYGRALYFWSFMVALLLFSGGGVFSLYEGIHKFREPEPVDKVWLGLAVLGFSLAVEGWATISNVFEMKRRRGDKPLLRYLRETKDSDLVVVFGENLAATLGLVLAMIALAIASVTGDSRWDGIGSMAIGAILIAVAIFLAIEIKSLLVGEAADSSIGLACHALAKDEPHVQELLNVITVQQGPGQVMVAIKARFDGSVQAEQIAKAINSFETKLHERCPEVKWIFMEPDLER